VPAANPNITVKLSGAPSYSSEPYPYRNIHKYIRQIFDACGAQRCFTEELPWLQGRDKDLVMGRRRSAARPIEGAGVDDQALPL
jgi:hypothetical protein